MTFSVKTPAAKEFFTFNFARRLSAGETIVSAAWTVTVKEGTDASPSALLSGSPAISGSRVSHLIIGGVADTRYCLQCVATTSAGQEIALTDDVWIRDACFDG